MIGVNRTDINFLCGVKVVIIYVEVITYEGVRKVNATMYIRL